ncbi:MAG TPA: hypothetical protein VF516_21370 [Kofleriaceae bacterium]
MEIWHIDVVGSGDSTLIIATDDGVGAGHVAMTRSALIDGGRTSYANHVHNRITTQGLAALDVMVATHYDEDHYGGLRSLLNMGNAIYANTRVYDQGEPGMVTAKRDRAQNWRWYVSGRDPQYQAYVNAVGARVRPTGRVLAGRSGPGVSHAGWHDPDWLVGTEILLPPAPVPRGPGAPTLTCVAANQYVLRAAGAGTRLVSAAVLGDQLKNAKSLAFLLRFGNFKYYVGGDIVAVQEDGSQWNGNGYTVAQANRNNSLMQYLNQGNNVANRVHALKTSHHGSKYSSSPAFLARLRPRAAFISCGTDNQYDHPDQQVVTALHNDPTVRQYFLTGEWLNGTANLTNFATVAGVWLPGTAAHTHRGDLCLGLTAAQAGAALVQFTVDFFSPNAGTNIHKNPAFAYAPFGAFQMPF